MRKQHTETAARATAVLVAAATLASGTVAAGPAAWAADQNETGTTQTKKTVREQLEQTVAEATAKKDIQDKTSGGAYTADTYGILSDRLTDAQNLLDDPDTSDDRLQSALDALDKAVKNLKVASWTVNGVALTGDQTLTADIGLDAKPGSLTAIGSDGTKVDLSISGADERHPALGVTSGTAVAGAPRDGTRPSISVHLSWTSGQEQTAYGRSFWPAEDGTWTLSQNVALDAGNQPAETSVTIGGETVDITWDALGVKDGMVSMSGRAEGSVDGQKWRIDYTASRDVDQSALDALEDAVESGRAMLDDTTHEYTAASRRTLDDALGEAGTLDGTATSDQCSQAMAAIAKAERDLVPVTWTVDINGTAMGLTRHDNGGWTLDTGLLDKALSVESGHKLTITSNDPTLGDKGRVTLSADTWKTSRTNEPDKDSSIGFGQWVENGSAVLFGSSKGRRTP